MLSAFRYVRIKDNAHMMKIIHGVRAKAINPAAPWWRISMTNNPDTA